jgi:hypothetical protein
MPVILATKEAEMGGSRFKVSPAEKLVRPSLKKTKKARPGDLHL